MPRLKVDSFGTKGVNVVDSPLHLSDDDLINAQNAEIFFEDGYPAIRKRLGMAEGVTAALDGPVFALTSIPLVDPAPSVPPPSSALTHSIWMDITGPTFAYSIDSTGSFEPEATSVASDIGTGAALPLWPTIGGKVYFSDGTVNGQVNRYTRGGAESSLTAPSPLTLDGASWTINGFVRHLCTDGTFLYCVGEYARLGNTAWVIFKVDVGLASWTQVGEAFCTAGMASGRIVEDGINGMQWWQDRLWVMNVTGAFGAVKVRSIDPALEVTWTLDETIGGAGISSDYANATMLVYDNATAQLALIANPATTGAGGTKATIRLRDTAGAWTTLEDSPTTNGDFYSLIYNAEKLVVFRALAAGGYSLRVSTDFATFAEVYDYADVETTYGVGTTVGRHSGAALLDGLLHFQTELGITTNGNLVLSLDGVTVDWPFVEVGAQFPLGGGGVVEV